MEPHRIILLISRIRERANRFIKQELNKNNIEGLVPSHGDILMLLLNNKELPMNELAKRIDRKKNTITKLVNKLIKLGYVVKKTSEKDKRVNLISLTQKGKELKPIFIQISKDLISKTYKGFSENKKTEVANLLTEIYNNWR